MARDTITAIEKHYPKNASKHTYKHITALLIDSGEQFLIRRNKTERGLLVNSKGVPVECSHQCTARHLYSPSPTYSLTLPHSLSLSLTHSLSLSHTHSVSHSLRLSHFLLQCWLRNQQISSMATHVGLHRGSLRQAAWAGFREPTLHLVEKSEEFLEAGMIKDRSQLLMLFFS